MDTKILEKLVFYIDLSMINLILTQIMPIDLAVRLQNNIEI